MTWAILSVALLFPGWRSFIVIDTPHYGATIVIDREPAGHAPLPPQAISPGFHVIEVLAPGHTPWSRLVFVAPGATLEIKVELPPRDQPLRRPGEVRAAEEQSRHRYDLSGRAGLSYTRLGDDDDWDVGQQWRLDAFELAGKPQGLSLGGAVGVRSWSDLDGGKGRLLGVHDSTGEGSELALDEARLRLESDRLGAVVDAGRVPVAVGRRRAAVLDGLVLGVAPSDGPVDARIGMGRRAVPVGLDPEVRALALAGFGVHPWGDAAFLRGHYVRHGGDHLEGEAGGEWLALRFGGHGSFVGGRSDERGLWVGYGAPNWGLRIEGSQRRPAPSALDDSISPLASLLEPFAPDWDEIRSSWVFDGGGVSAAAGLRVHGGRGEAAPRSPDFVDASGELRWHRSALVEFRVLGARFDADIGPPSAEPALQSSLRGAAGVAFTPGPLRIDASAGANHLVLQDASRTLPEGAAELFWAFSAQAGLALTTEAMAVHPIWLPGGGPLVSTAIELRIR